MNHKLFLKYCKQYPIDIDTIRKLDIEAFNFLQCNSQFITSADNVYVTISTDWHAHLLQFKDEAAYNLYSICLGLYKPIGKFSFNYNEFDISINNHDLKYVFIVIKSNLRAYTVDNNRQVIFISANDYILVSESINRILTNFHICGFNKDIYKFIYKIPSQLNELVSLQRVIMALNN